eukprot:9502487-Pyramimonas_sp.AAC.1
MEGNSGSRCGSRLCAAHIRLHRSQEFHCGGAAHFQNVALVLAPRTVALETCNTFGDPHGRNQTKKASRY